MKFLILFAIGAFFGCVQCDQECFRAVFKDCVKQPVPSLQMTLCDGIKFQIECLSHLADKCDMDFKFDAEDLKLAVEHTCNSSSIFKKIFDEERPCYKASVSDSDCDGSITEALKNAKTTEEIIKANKKVCSLFKPYSVCVEEKVIKNCGIASDMLFEMLFNPYKELSNSVCEQLILPADEKDSRPDNFGILNVYSSLATMFGSA